LSVRLRGGHAALGILAIIGRQTWGVRLLRRHPRYDFGKTVRLRQDTIKAKAKGAPAAAICA
jgi:hypothetical protein